MSTLNKADIISAISFIASGGLTASVATFSDAIDKAWPGVGAKVMIYAAIVTALCGVLTRIFANKSGAPATAVTADAVFVAPNTPTVTAKTQSIPITTAATPVDSSTPTKGTP